MVKGLLNMSIDASKLAEMEALLPDRPTDVSLWDFAIQEIIMLRKKLEENQHGGTAK